jgi:hypothetical protein
MSHSLKASFFLVLILAATFSTSSCKKSKSGTPEPALQNPPPPQSTANTWKMDNYKYVRGGSAGEFDGSVTALVISTSGFSNANGFFSGSSVGISFWGGAVGTYTIKSSETVAQAHLDNPALKFLSVFISVGIEFSNATGYESQDSNVTASVTLVNGKYHVTISSPVSLIKSVNVGTGVPNAPNSFNFTCDDIY